MTLPFRRRHHDDESSHDRARALGSIALLEPLGAADAAWLAGHLERCPECRTEQAGFEADRALLRGLRDAEPAPPRDLWARTAAAIEAQARPADGRAAGIGSLGRTIIGPTRRGIPIGPLSGALVAIVVLAVAFQSQGIPVTPPASNGSINVAVGSPPGGPTPFPVGSADHVAWVESNGDGQYSIVIAALDQACPPDKSDCAALQGGTTTSVTLGAQPQAIVLSPGSDQAAVVGAAGEAAGSVIIVSVPAPHPTATPPASGAPTATASPSVTQPASPGASGSLAPEGNGHAIIHGVVVVGDASYSANGQWLAFSARPLVGDRGPDLDLWHAGDDQATRLTDDGSTFFAGWFGDQIVASGVLSAVTTLDGSSPSPNATEVPSASPAEPSIAASPEASATAPELHPFSFLLDPSTGVRTTFAQPDVWLPAIDPAGRFVTYWLGTVTPATTANGPLHFGAVTGWRPATGRLVLDGWASPLGSPVPASSGATGSPDATASAGAPEASADGSAAPSVAPVAAGPAGTPIELAPGPLVDFEAAFDPTGSRLAVWVGDPVDATIGRLRLLVLDPALGAIDAALDPLAAPGVVALRGLSIESGRLGWVSPPGQDGEPSSVQVLAWDGDAFGQIQSAPGGSPQIIR